MVGYCPWPSVSSKSLLLLFFKKEALPLSLSRSIPLPKKLEELHALAQPALHHLRAAHHFTHDRGDLRRAEVELLIKRLDAVEYLGVRQMRVGQRRDLDAVV